MAQFEKMETPEINRTSYRVTDDFGNMAHLSPEQAYHLLHWLYDRRDELFKTVHNLPEQHKPGDTLPAWLTETPEQFVAGFTEQVTTHQEGKKS